MQTPTGGCTTTFDGQVIAGAVASRTVTVKVQEPILPDASVAVQVTVVVPTGKPDPEAGTQTTVALPQLSVPVGVVYVTVAVQVPTGALVTMFAGHVTVGFVASLTVTVNMHEPVLPAGSVAVHVTVVVPTGKLDPEAGSHTTVALPQLSLPVGVT